MLLLSFFCGVVVVGDRGGGVARRLSPIFEDLAQLLIINTRIPEADQPEVALRYYRRLLQMGANSPEVWQNLGLCCFYAAQYDMALKCFESALAAASDDTAADVW